MLLRYDLDATYIHAGIGSRQTLPAGGAAAEVQSWFIHPHIHIKFDET